MSKPIIHFKDGEGVFLNGQKIDHLLAVKVDSEALDHTIVTLKFHADVKGLDIGKTKKEKSVKING